MPGHHYRQEEHDGCVCSNQSEFFCMEQHIIEKDFADVAAGAKTSTLILGKEGRGKQLERNKLNATMTESGDNQKIAEQTCVCESKWIPPQEALSHTLQGSNIFSVEREVRENDGGAVPGRQVEEDTSALCVMSRLFDPPVVSVGALQDGENITNVCEGRFGGTAKTLLPHAVGHDGENKNSGEGTGGDVWQLPNLSDFGTVTVDCPSAITNMTVEKAIKKDYVMGENVGRGEEAKKQWTAPFQEGRNDAEMTPLHSYIDGLQPLLHVSQISNDTICGEKNVLNDVPLQSTPRQKSSTQHNQMRLSHGALDVLSGSRCELSPVSPIGNKKNDKTVHSIITAPTQEHTICGEDRVVCGVQHKTYSPPLNYPDLDSIRRALMLLKGRQQRCYVGNRNALINSTIPEPTHNRPTWRAKPSSTKPIFSQRDNATPKYCTSSSFSFSSYLPSGAVEVQKTARAMQTKSASTLPPTASFSHPLQKGTGTGRRRLKEGKGPSGRVYSTSLEDQPKIRAAATVTRTPSTLSSKVGQRETSPIPSAVIPVVAIESATMTTKTLEVEPMPLQVPPVPTPFLASKSTFIFPAMAQEVQNQNLAQNKAAVNANMSSWSERLSASIASSEKFVFPSKRKTKGTMQSLTHLRLEYLDRKDILNADAALSCNNIDISKENRKNCRNVSRERNTLLYRGKRWEERQQVKRQSNLALPPTQRRWSDTPVYNIMAHVPSTQASTRAPSVSSVHQRPPTVPSERENGFLSYLPQSQEVRTVSARNDVESVVTLEVNPVETDVRVTQPRGSFSVLTRHQLLPFPSPLDVQFKAVAQRMCGAETENNMTVQHVVQSSDHCHNDDYAQDDMLTLSRHVVDRSEVVRQIVHRSRETITQRNEELAQHLQPEERALWHTLKEKIKCLQDRAAELKRRVREWDKKHSHISSDAEKKLKIVQSRKYLAVREWEAVEDLCWEYFTAQLLRGVKKPLGNIMLPPL